eukprot:CAMPEP_0119321156 /NCGR_PEP_ID=MMETSP1333-20130426/54586_1 /TAXON_ID=418940 /ORGANISM="Scyphosphaera apsteinii, Strain RCC1455" /LENGTH=474 /DNA_ID=CAMNT_0007328067 /DNA_START=107 /DNA_END=1531 /DNA_ORIENTATION=+
MMVWNIRAHVRFYNWFFHSGISLANKRGLGAHPTKIYGLITPPTLTPAQLVAAGISFISCLLLSCTPLAPRVFLFLGYLLYFCYFPQLYAEATLSGHSTILIPSLLLLLSCAPSLDHQVQSRHVWPLQLIRLYIASGYFSSGMCKLLCGVRFHSFWGNGSTLQAYIFDGMWSRPSRGPVVRSLQWALLTRPEWSTFLACGSLLFETGFVLTPFNNTLGLIFGVNGLLFHGGILLLQGLDFVSLWSPALFSFIVSLPADQSWYELLRSGYDLEFAFFLPAALYTTLQILVAASLYDLWLDDVLPLSCCPMFMPPRNPFDKLPKWWTMVDGPLAGSTRNAGAMEPLYWSPASSVFEMTVEEAMKLPWRVVWFGSTTGCPQEVLKFIAPESQGKPFVMFANFQLSAELKQLLHRVVDEVNSGDLSDAWDRAKMHQLLCLQQECLNSFTACAAAARTAEGAEAHSSRGGYAHECCKLE